MWDIWAFGLLVYLISDLVQKKKSVLESQKKKLTMSVAILCPPVCVYDIMNKTGMFGKSAQGVKSQTFSLSLLVKSEPIWLCLEALWLKAEEYFFCVNRRLLGLFWEFLKRTTFLQRERKRTSGLLQSMRVFFAFLWGFFDWFCCM